MLIMVCTDSSEFVQVNNAEVIISALEWIRTVFPQFCHDIINGNILPRLRLTAPIRNYDEQDPYAGVSFQLDDDMAAAAGHAISQSTHLRELQLCSREMTDLSAIGVAALARGIASSPSLQSLTMFDFEGEEEEAAQLRVDIVCKRLRESQTIMDDSRLTKT